MEHQNQRQISKRAAEGLTSAQVDASSGIWTIFNDHFITKGLTAEALTPSREEKRIKATEKRAAESWLAS